MDTSSCGCRVRLAEVGWVQRHRTSGGMDHVCAAAMEQPAPSGRLVILLLFPALNNKSQSAAWCRPPQPGQGRGRAHPLRLSFRCVFLRLLCLLANISETTLSTHSGRHASGRLFQKQELTVLWGEGWPGSPSSTRGHVLMTLVPAMLLRWRWRTCLALARLDLALPTRWERRTCVDRPSSQPRNLPLRC